MPASYICSRCSRRLVQYNRRLHAATFVSFGQLVSKDNRSVREDYSEVKEHTKVQKDPTINASKASAATETIRENDAINIVEGIFKNLKRDTLLQSRTRYSRTLKPLPVQQVTNLKDDHQQRKDIAQVVAQQDGTDERLLELREELRLRTIPIAAVWTSLVDLFDRNPDQSWGELSEYRGQSKKLQSKGSVVSYVLRSVLVAVSEDERTHTRDGVISPADVIEKYRQHKAMLYWWHQILWLQLAKVLRLRLTDLDAVDEKAKKKRINALLVDISNVWYQFMVHHGAVPNLDFMFKVAFKPPDRPFRPGTPMDIRFLHLLPSHPSYDALPKMFATAVPRMAAAAVMTLDCVEAEDFKLAPYLHSFFKRLKESGPVDGSVAWQALCDNNLAREAIEKALIQWKFRPENYLRGAVGGKFRNDDLTSRTMPQKARRIPSWSNAIINARMVNIDSARTASDVQQTERLWDDFQLNLHANNNLDEERISKIFAQFLRSFWQFGRTDKAIAVWNTMVKSPYKPNQSHWTAMITGCEKGKDVDSMQRIWSNMLQSGTQPNLYCWTAYIHGLIRLRKWQEGLASLDLLGKTWKRPAAAEPENSATVPAGAVNTEENTLQTLTADMAPVHAALSALIDTNRHDLTTAVIAWAESQSLRLTTYTFNILLRPIVRTGNQEHIASHLNQMQTRGCSPDITTFTIILNGLVSNPTSIFPSLSHEEQEKIILSTLKDMETQNITLTPQTYTVLLDGILSRKPRAGGGEHITPNIALARNILKHMQVRNVRPSSHIHTILATHYFSLNPPDLPAIDSLWASIRNSNHPVDFIFYDRMIENYAALNHYEKALSILQRVPGEGKIPGWKALANLLLALERAEEWDLCAVLIADVESPEGLLRYGEGNRRGKGEFWMAVDRLRDRGVLGKDDRK
ncbi:hypothetical protein MMC21_004997 [Puttea exsequens]|nr:hypothetical protein [Puttea exsequens]